MYVDKICILEPMALSLSVLTAASSIQDDKSESVSFLKWLKEVIC